jgi:hypothetical protein
MKVCINRQGNHSEFAKKTNFRLVVDEPEFRRPRNEHAGFRLLDDETN